jgi:DNA-binding CsgD family transcriptional regulator/PAS domain-containing protein
MDAALRVLLTPISHPQAAATWFDDVARTVSSIVDGVLGVSMLDWRRPALLHSTLCDSVTKPYLAYYHTVNTVEKRVMHRRLEVGHPLLVGRRGEFSGTEFMCDYAVPLGLLDSLTFTTYGRTGTRYQLFLSMGREHGDAELEGDLPLLRPLQAAWQAGIDAWQRFQGGAAFAAGMLDALDQPVSLHRADGGVLHENPAFTAMAGAEAGTALRQAAREMAIRAGRSLSGGGEVLAAGPLERVVSTAAGRHRLSVVVADADSLAACPVLMVTISGGDGREMSDDALRSVYRLTAREVEVARLLAAGISNDELAARLGLSANTARRHTQNVLSKLRVPNRASVGAALRGSPERLC